MRACLRLRACVCARACPCARARVHVSACACVCVSACACVHPGTPVALCPTDPAPPHPTFLDLSVSATVSVRLCHCFCLCLVPSLPSHTPLAPSIPDSLRPSHAAPPSPYCPSSLVRSAPAPPVPRPPRRLPWKRRRRRGVPGALPRCGVRGGRGIVPTHRMSAERSMRLRRAQLGWGRRERMRSRRWRRDGGKEGFGEMQASETAHEGRAG